MELNSLKRCSDIGEVNCFTTVSRPSTFLIMFFKAFLIRTEGLN